MVFQGPWWDLWNILELCFRNELHQLMVFPMILPWFVGVSTIPNWWCRISSNIFPDLLAPQESRLYKSHSMEIGGSTTMILWYRKPPKRYIMVYIYILYYILGKIWFIPSRKHAELFLGCEIWQNVSKANGDANPSGLSEAPRPKSRWVMRFLRFLRIPYQSSCESSFRHDETAFRLSWLSSVFQNVADFCCMRLLMWICMNADSAHCALWWTFSWMLELLENRALENTRNVLSHCFSTRAGYVAGKAGWLSLQVKTLYDCLPWAQHLICLPWIWTMRGLAESPTLHKLGRSESPKSRVRRECVASANMSFVAPAKVQCLKTWRKDRWPNWWDSVGVNGPSGSIVILTVSPVKSLSPMRRNDLASISDDFCIVYIHLRRLPDPCWLILL